MKFAKFEKIIINFYELVEINVNLNSLEFVKSVKILENRPFQCHGLSWILLNFNHFTCQAVHNETINFLACKISGLCLQIFFLLNGNRIEIQVFASVREKNLVTATTSRTFSYLGHHASYFGHSKIKFLEIYETNRGTRKQMAATVFFCWISRELLDQNWQ